VLSVLHLTIVLQEKSAQLVMNASNVKVQVIVQVILFAHQAIHVFNVSHLTIVLQEKSAQLVMNASNVKVQVIVKMIWFAHQAIHVLSA
jgi:hypothetical protein